MAVTPRYITNSDIETRLYGKVNFLGINPLPDSRFSIDDNNNGLTEDQVATFINRAASQVEFALSPLYLIPFQASDATYASLTASTQDFLNELIIIRTCIIILQTEFAIDTGAKGEQFIKQLQQEYKETVYDKLLIRSPEGKYLYPPLLGLQTNGNQFDLSAPLQAPVVVHNDCTDGLSYANCHINDPAKRLFYPFAYNWWGRNYCGNWNNWHWTN